MAKHFHGGYEHDHDEAGYHEHTGYNVDGVDELDAVTLAEPVVDPTMQLLEDGHTERTAAEADAAVAIAEVEAAADVAIAEANADADVAIAEADARARAAEAGVVADLVDETAEEDVLDDVVEEIADELRDELEDLDVEELPDPGDVVEVTVPPQIEDAPAAAAGGRAPRPRSVSRFARRRR